MECGIEIAQQKYKNQIILEQTANYLNVVWKDTRINTSVLKN